MPTHSSSLAWRIPGTEEPGGDTLRHGVAESDTTEQLGPAQHRCGPQNRQDKDTVTRRPCKHDAE